MTLPNMKAEVVSPWMYWTGIAAPSPFSVDTFTVPPACIPSYGCSPTEDIQLGAAFRDSNHDTRPSLGTLPDVAISSVPPASESSVLTPDRQRGISVQVYQCLYQSEVSFTIYQFIHEIAPTPLHPFILLSVR